MKAVNLSKSVLFSIALATLVACAEEDESPDPGVQRAAVPADEGPPPECAPKDTPPALCSGATWTDRAPLVSTSAEERLGSITPDGLVIATTVARLGGGADILVATRDDVNDRFPAPTPVAGGPWAEGRAALSADGLRLVAIDPSRRKLVELARGSRAAAFVATPGDGFATLNQHAAFYSFTAETYADPVLSASGLTLYYARFGTTATKTIYASHRASVNEAWSLGAPVDGAALESAFGKRKVPTGVSTDERTMFFVDEATGRSAATTRRAETCGFEAAATVDLGDRSYAAPNAACDTLWFSAAGASGLGVFVESRARR